MADYKNILLAIDFSAIAGVVAQRAAAVAKQHAAKITVLHVVEFLPPLNIGDEPLPSPGWVVEEDVLVKNAQRSLSRFCKNNHLSPAEQIVTVGVPKYEIIRIAEEKKVDMIIIGSYGRHGWSRLLGSTASGVINNAPCDVLAVKIKEK